MSEFARVEWAGSGQYVTDRQHQALKAAERSIRKRYWGFRFDHAARVVEASDFLLGDDAH